MRHKRDATPAYLIWVERRPSNSGKGKASYVEAVQSAARREIARPISTADIEVEIVYSTSAKLAERLDADNVNKATLDALKAIAYIDDGQVRSVTSTLFDRTADHHVEGRVEHMGRLFYSPHQHVVLLMIYSDSRLRELGGSDEVKRKRYEAWQQEFDDALARVKNGRPPNSGCTRRRPPHDQGE